MSYYQLQWMMVVRLPAVFLQLLHLAGTLSARLDQKGFLYRSRNGSCRKKWVIEWLSEGELLPGTSRIPNRELANFW